MASAAAIPRHLVIWRDPPVWPFLWRGLLPLAALATVVLIAAGPFAHLSIQDTVERELRAQLSEAGFTWVGVSVSGQSVQLAGVEPQAGTGEQALQLARAATCPTWLGRRTCAVEVNGRFLPPVVAAPAATAAVTTSATAHLNEAPAPVIGSRQACEQSLANILGSEQIDFASGSARIDAKSGTLLDTLAREVRGCPGKIRIEGHTDTMGRGRFNRRLSDARAAAVRSALIARGIPATRLSAKGYGARRPIADNATEEGRARNRRIEFHTVSAN
jgi:outer membrane protein OmpA-like peptidoglycan-associated protein